MSETKWQDPVFGYVPEEYQEWYEKNSGTYWNDKLKKWLVNGTIIRTVLVEHEGKNGKKWISERRIMLAHDFQDAIGLARKTIESQMPIGSYYTIGRTSIYGLMRDLSTKVKYTLEGQDFVQDIETF